MSAVGLNGEYRHAYAQKSIRSIAKFAGRRRMDAHHDRADERDEDRGHSVVGFNPVRKMKRYCEDRREVRMALNNLDDPDLLDRIEGGRVLRTR